MLSIIICTYKRPQLLQNCLKGAMQALEGGNTEIIVVNDAKDSTVSVPQHEAIRVVRNEGQGVASARNFGAKQAQGDLLLFVDDDIEFDAANVKALLTAYEQRPPACYNPNWRYSDEMYREIEKTQFGRFLIHHNLISYKGWVIDLDWQDHIFEAKQLAAFFLLMPKAFFEKVGGFNESFTNQGTEDDELCKRLRKAGIRMFIDPNNYVFHNEMDRVTLPARLKRFHSGAANRRRAHDMGMEGYEIKYTGKKRKLLSAMLPFESALVAFAKLIPNRRAFDLLYFKMANALIALTIYKGYTGKK